MRADNSRGKGQEGQSHPHGAFLRLLPESFDISGVDADKIKAKYVDGVLRLTLPKLEQRLPEGRRLEIE